MLMDGFARWILSAIAPHPDRVPYVRKQAEHVLRLWRIKEDPAWTVELLLTELVTNVVRHARTPFTIMLTWDGRTLGGEVSDVNPVPPQVRTDPVTDDTGGRGLLLVDNLSQAWGVDRRPHGKTIWFKIAAAA